MTFLKESLAKNVPVACRGALAPPYVVQIHQCPKYKCFAMLFSKSGGLEQYTVFSVLAQGYNSHIVYVSFLDVDTVSVYI